MINAPSQDAVRSGTCPGGPALFLGGRNQRGPRIWALAAFALLGIGPFGTDAGA